MSIVFPPPLPNPSANGLVAGDIEFLSTGNVALKSTGTTMITGGTNYTLGMGVEGCVKTIVVVNAVATITIFSYQLNSGVIEPNIALTLDASPNARTSVTLQYQAGTWYPLSSYISSAP